MFRGVLTFRLTGQLRSVPGGAGCSSVAGSAVTREADWDAALKAAETLGGLHGLINNAGIYQPKRLLDTDAELFERHMRVNQLGCFLGMKCVVPLMERSGGGSIIAGWIMATGMCGASSRARARVIVVRPPLATR